MKIPLLRILDLGSAGGFPVPRRYQRTVSIDRADARDGVVLWPYQVDTVAFYTRKCGCSSGCLPAKEDVVNAFAINDGQEVFSISHRQVCTVDNNFSGVYDLVKTDLEGLDGGIIMSSNVIQSALAIKCELRFNPLYQDEVEASVIINLLNAQGFSLVAIEPQVWKYATRSRAYLRDGVFAAGDFIFFRNTDDPYEVERQAYIADLLGLGSYAEHLWERKFGPNSGFHPRISPLNYFVTLLHRLPGGFILVGLARRIFARLHLACRIYRQGSNELV